MRGVAAIFFADASMVAMLAGCTVGPDYHPPKPVMPDHFVEQRAAPAAADGRFGAADSAWWKQFNDATLDQLVAQALRTAPDLAGSEARIREARAMRGVVRSTQYPQVHAEPSYQRIYGSENVPLGTPPGGWGPGLANDLWLANFDASWEIDIFGGQRRAVESANASVQASIENHRDVMLTLIAEIARNYVELRSTQRRLEIARETSALRQDTLSLFRVQFVSELATSLDLARAKAALANIQAEIPILTSAGRSAIYRIAVLIGDHPEKLLSTLDSSGSIPEASGNVPVGLPSDLLKRRPDIRLAERRIAAANAKIGVAQADLYPHFSLTGMAGLESLSAANFLNPSSFFFAIGPSIKWSIFDAGKVRNQILAERARTDIAAAAYQKTVLGALREVETALVAYGQEQVRREALTQEVAANRDALNLAKRLYQQGVEDFLAVLDADRSLHSTEDRLVLSQRDMSINLIALYKSLGGGWENLDKGAIGKSE